MEAGRLVPAPDDARRYAQALGASQATVRRLVRLVDDLREKHRAAVPARVGVSRGAAHEQRVLRNETGAARICVFHPLLIPGALQSEPYIRSVFSSGGLSPDVIESRTAARLRRAELLADPDRSFTFVITHGALGWRPAGPPEIMATQLDHLGVIAARPNVRLGVIPWGAPATVFPPCGFDLYDGRTAVVGVVGGAAYYTDPDDVGRYERMFSELERVAVFDADAGALLDELADRFVDGRQ
jgi:hypothetical protein